MVLLCKVSCAPRGQGLSTPRAVFHTRLRLARFARGRPRLVLKTSHSTLKAQLCPLAITPPHPTADTGPKFFSNRCLTRPNRDSSFEPFEIENSQPSSSPYTVDNNRNSLTNGKQLITFIARKSSVNRKIASLCQSRKFSKMCDDLSRFTLPNDQPLVIMDCNAAFDALTEKEKLYAHYLSRASWYGGLIVLVQTSPESPLIFALIHKVFAAQPIDDLKKAALASGVDKDEFTAFMVYVCGVLGNAGNYKAFGDSKIVPNLPKPKFDAILKSSEAYKKNPEELNKIWNEIGETVYKLDETCEFLGLGGKGVTTYFSPNCTHEDADIVNEFMQSKRQDSYNARCFKTTEIYEDSGAKKSRNVYEIRLASQQVSDDEAGVTMPEEIFKDAKFKITRGDYSNVLGILIENLEKALPHAANDNEKNMIEKYVSHFKTGSLNDHKDGSRFWIRDKGPAVETYIGFIENYRDPAGQRGEFEGFVAMVNKEMSRKFATLVTRAEELLLKLPWGADFEKDQFLRPDFTSLDILTYAGSGIPSGINIPNYDEIRQNEGFKNVSLGNVIPAVMKRDVIPFLSDEDQVLMNKYRVPSFDVQVGLHELLGHGSGKLFRKLKNGDYNFDIGKVTNPITNGPIEKYYSDGETYDSKFGALSSSYEECRAEAVGLYLSLEKDVTKIFGYEGDEADDIVYVNWLSLLWGGCARALEVYQPTTGKWLQAHLRARFALLRVCIEAGQDFVKVEEIEAGKNLRLTVDRSKIASVGKTAVGNFLKKLQIYKSTGDFEAAKIMYDGYTNVPESGPQPWAKWRNIVLAHKQPRPIFVQSNTFVNDSDANKVILKNYEPTFNGLVQSWVERFPSSDVPKMLIDLWEKDRRYFSPGKRSD